jgi:hypothetical protein
MSFSTVAELDAPGNDAFFLVAADAHRMAQRGEIGVTAHVDRVMRAGLDARVALPAHVRLDVVGAPCDFIDVHDV